MTISHTCPCGAAFDVSITFGQEPRTYGRPEDCDEGSDDEIEPGECPECGQDVDQVDVMMAASYAAEDARMERALIREQDRLESRNL